MKNMERKKKGEKNKQENAHLQSHNTTCNLYTKSVVSILNGCGDIFDEKSGEKETRTNVGKNK